MGSLKTIKKNQVEFLMDFDYDNVLGRLTFVLGASSSFFANILIRNGDIVWSTRNDKVYLPLSDADNDTVSTVKNELKKRLDKVSTLIADDFLIGPHLSKIISYPSDNYVFFSLENGDIDIVLAGWGCQIQGGDSNADMKAKEDEISYFETKAPVDSSDNEDIIKVIEQLQENGRFKEAYNLCLECIKKKENQVYANKKCSELIPILKKQAKNDSLKNTLIIIVITIMVAIFSILLSKL